MTSPSLIELAEARVPRYTSYPTALQFTDACGEDTCRSWLSSLTGQDSLSLYVHVPFCQSMCWYCGCNTTIPNSYDRAARYVDVLLGEIAAKRALISDPGTVTHLHFGGGTPTYLKGNDFGRIIAALKDAFPFADNAEIAVEIDPRTLKQEHLEAFRRSGVNRASLGVQDFNEEVQKSINRIQPFDLVEKAVDDLRSIGIEGISLDLMYGLPGQDENSVRMTARTALRLSPERFSVFGYAHVPWFKKHQQVLERADLPGTTERLKQAEAIASELTAAGFERIGFDHYARPDDDMAEKLSAGEVSRNFQGYTTDAASALIGFGASAISSFPDGISQNEPHLGKYNAAVRKGCVPAVKGVPVTPDDRLRGDIISRLMCDLKVNVAEVRGLRGGSKVQFKDSYAAIDRLSGAGVVERDGDVITVTEQGRPFVRNIAACFDAWLEHGSGRHSQGV